MSSRYQRRIELKEKTASSWAQGAGAFYQGNVLIIGEQPAISPDHGRDMGHPFCSDDGCSGWLNSLLDQEHVPEEKLYWINAKYANGTYVELFTYVNELKPSKIVALGKVAKNACDLRNFPCLYAHHPQYWKRFRNKERYPLLDILKTCV